MCALCIEKKKLHPEGLIRQYINVSSVNFHCAVWGVFWNTTSSEMWRCKQVGYYMHKFITNKIKKELSFCLFSLVMIFFFFFLERRPVSGVVCKFKCPLKKRSVSAHAVRF